ncbi:MULTISPECIES: hypothetical protein [Cytobacillus]|uniref:Uncharacterized protein n=2 Tax=Bacillaceae TaxID=186817 RepID=A0A248TPP4_9BACI|nr:MULTISPECIES: hypothetical protein [Cytobacillus]ASV70167.1 hypothetical protein CKF48_23040 [Cytobacillus kochii]MDQ0186739.1 hypothetical protein [Cytobacillus kochii]MEC1155801.1 hypothetical protein [Cytobacillus horneckiae]
MKVVIMTKLNTEGSMGLRRGSFLISDYEFKKNPDWYIGIKAYEWIQQQIAEYGGRKTEIIQVTWNEENDITEVVKSIYPIMPEDDLPF